MLPTTIINTHDAHQIAVYTRGNPKNPAVLFLHGGPGGHISEKSFSFFNLDAWFVVAFDQRGCGQSKPFASLVNNTPQHAIEDIEAIRNHFKIELWTVFGGSYGSTLALLYAQHYPKHVANLVLRGVFLGRNTDIQWLYQEGTSYFYPLEHERFKTFIDAKKRHNLVHAYYEIFTSNDTLKKYEAAKIWSDWEGSVVHLVPTSDLNKQPIQESDISLATLECHFFANHMFWKDDNTILNNIHPIKDIPTYIVHGRYDVDCRLSAAYELQAAMNNAQLIISEASGHSPHEENMFHHLKAVMLSLETKL